MRRLTAEQEAAIAALNAMRGGRLDMEGGYPAVVDGYTIEGYVLIADANDNDGPTLTVYRWPDLLRWYQKALRWLETNPPEDEYDLDRWEEVEEAIPGIVHAMYETEPEGIDISGGGP